MRLITWSLLLGVFMLSGCSLFSKKTGNEPMELQDFQEQAQVRTLWSRGMGAGQSASFTRLAPFLDGDTLYVLGHKGELFAADPASGKVRWSRKLKEAMNAGVASERGMLLLASAGGEVIVLSNTDGRVLWRKQLNGEILSSPRTNGEVVAVQAINGRLFVLDAATGEEKWFYDNPPPVLTLRGAPSPIVTDNAIYAGFSNGRLMAFDPDNGSILWEQRVALPQGRSELDRMVDIHSSPVLREGVIYVSTYQGKLSAVARGTGSALWSQDSSSSEAIAVTDTRIFVSQADGRLVARSLATGEVLWENSQLLRRRLSGPQVVGDYVAVSDYKGYLHVLDQQTGELVARKRVGRKPIHAPMLTDGERLYVYTNKGKLYALTLRAR